MQYPLIAGRRKSPRAILSTGFSLVELMVTIAVLAIIMAIAAPSFVSLYNSNRLTSQANEIIVGLQEARSDALRRNAAVTVCRSTDGLTCANSIGAWEHWITVDAGNAVVRHQSAKPPVGITANVHRVVFRPDGLARAADGSLLDAAIAVCMPTSRPAENQRNITIRLGGRVAVTSLDAGGACT